MAGAVGLEPTVCGLEPHGLPLTDTPLVTWSAGFFETNPIAELKLSFHERLLTVEWTNVVAWDPLVALLSRNAVSYLSQEPSTVVWAIHAWRYSSNPVDVEVGKITLLVLELDLAHNDHQNWSGELLSSPHCHTVT